MLAEWALCDKLEKNRGTRGKYLFLSWNQCKTNFSFAVQRYKSKAWLLNTKLVNGIMTSAFAVQEDCSLLDFLLFLWKQAYDLRDPMERKLRGELIKSPTKKNPNK